MLFAYVSQGNTSEKNSKCDLADKEGVRHKELFSQKVNYMIHVLTLQISVYNLHVH